MLLPKDGELSKAEVLQFIEKSLERGRFNELFEAESVEMMRLVDQLFDTIFEEEFQNQTDADDKI